MPYVYSSCCYSQISQSTDFVIVCVKIVGSDGRQSLKWHVNDKVIQHHIIYTPADSQRHQNPSYTELTSEDTDASTYTWKPHVCVHIETRQCSLFSWCSYQEGRVDTHVHSSTLEARVGGADQRKCGRKKKVNTQGQPPPHKQGISLPKTKTPEQPTHIQRNVEGWKGLKKSGGVGGIRKHVAWVER